MTKYYTNIISILNICKKPSKKSEIVSQMIYGDSFSVLKKYNQWIKIKTKEDNYIGYVKVNKYLNFIKPTHNVSVLKAKIFNSPYNPKKINEFSFNSKIKVIGKRFDFLQFSGGWIKKNQVKSIDHIESNPFKKINIFKNIKYKWGGKSYKGIDCSALIQICLNFNNKFCPRDTKDQIRYFKNNISLSKLRKNDIIYWKGHVALIISNKNLIHAYGPMKKTIIMNIKKTIKLIQKTANLNVLKIKRL